MNSRAMMWVVLVAVRVYDPETKGLLNSRNWVTEDDNCTFELLRFFADEQCNYAHFIIVHWCIFLGVLET